MPLRLYNTLTKREEEFGPLDPSGTCVTFYTCGPTVYDYAHIGNFRSFLNADVLRRTLELLGYEVVQVMNMTDVGHMTDDDLADGGGEDKMEQAARRLREAKKAGALPHGTRVDPSDPYAIADFYADAFLRDAKALGLKVVRDAESRPELMPRPTRYVPQMIALIKKLIARKHAYIGSDGVVYFDVQSFPEYGRLSGNTPETIRSGRGGRVDAATQQLKRHPADFMLWKPDPSHIMKWPSPWGEGYPGWHLECSVMAMELLANATNGRIDIHSGGEDNIFPHHDCEIAQTCGATGETSFARYWFHTRFLLVEGEKMSKSKGSFYTLRDLLEKGASPASVRLELTRMHYRSNASFSFQGLRDSQRMIDRWMNSREALSLRAAASSPAGLAGSSNRSRTDGEDAAARVRGPFRAALARFTDAMCSDLNISGAIAAINEAVSEHQSSSGDSQSAADELRALETVLDTLGVADLAHEASAMHDDLAIEVERKIGERNQARRERNWKRADAIRDELLAMGVAIKDGPEGTTWSRVVQ